MRGGKIHGIGIGITGFADFERGALTRTASLPKLNHFAVVDYLKSRLGEEIRIVMDNDCHCGALAEYRRGAGKGHRNMLYCPVSTGISTGIIIDGKLFRGSNGASGKAITNYVKRWIKAGETSILPELAGGSGTYYGSSYQ